PLEDAISLVAELVPPVAEDRSLAGDIERVRDLVASGRLIGGGRAPSTWAWPTPGGSAAPALPRPLARRYGSRPARCATSTSSPARGQLRTPTSTSPAGR